MSHASARAGALSLALLAASASPSCYRAEIDLSSLANEPPDSVGGEPGGAGAGGAPGVAELECDDAQVDAEQANCRVRLPTLAECTEQDAEGWSGCYSGGCAVCTKSVADYPYYFDWHPCCLANDTCNSNKPVLCNARCPAPTEHDKVRPCWLAEAAP